MTRAFIGRATELNALKSRYDRNGFQMAVVYGRRRVGKTCLINKFVEDVAALTISFVAVERPERDLMDMMGEAVLSTLAPDLLGSLHFESFDAMFDFIAKRAADKRVVFVIDEYPYLAKECGYMNSLLQKYADHDWKSTQLYLILCGSLVSFMTDEVLSEQAPLHGRAGLELKVSPMDYRDSGEFVPGYSNEDKAIVYGLTGGIPKYLEQFDPEKSLGENIVEQFFTSTGYFTEEQIRTVVTADRSNPTALNAIIAAVANGHTKNNEIASASGLRDINYYLKALVSVGLLEKRMSNGKPYYVLADNMVAFWFKYVSRAASLINAGRGAQYYEHVVKDKLHDHMGKVFEEMARQYLFANMGTDKFPFFATDIVEYQTSVKAPDGAIKQVEIDLLGMEGTHVLFAGECKFRNQKMDAAAVLKFFDKLALIPAKSPTAILFSLSGFTPDALNHDAIYVDINDMYQ